MFQATTGSGSSVFKHMKKHIKVSLWLEILGRLFFLNSAYRQGLIQVLFLEIPREGQRAWYMQVYFWFALLIRVQSFGVPVLWSGGVPLTKLPRLGKPSASFPIPIKLQRIKN